MPKQEEINMAEDLPAPKSRKEEYLATAAGMTGIELPEPASREEIYLDAIAQGGGGGGGSAYTAGDGIDITNNEISVDTETIQPKLTAGTNITIDENNVISAEGGGAGGGATILTTDDYNWPANNPDGVALWKMPTGFYAASSTEPVKVYFHNSFSYTADATNLAAMVTDKINGVEIIQWHVTSSYDNYADVYLVGAVNGNQIKRIILKEPINNLTSTSTTAPLTAAQGKALNDRVVIIEGQLTGLESALNTINNGTGE